MRNKVFVPRLGQHIFYIETELSFLSTLRVTHIHKSLAVPVPKKKMANANEKGGVLEIPTFWDDLLVLDFACTRFSLHSILSGAGDDLYQKICMQK